MPDLATFARRIREIGQRVETNADAVKRQAAVAVDQAVVLATPVDTGRARGNWQASVGAPITTEIEQEDQIGQDTINRNNGVIETARSQQAIFISNNVPYIGFLNAGSSSQAPANFVEIAVQAGLRVVRNARLTTRRG